MKTEGLFIAKFAEKDILFRVNQMVDFNLVQKFFSSTISSLNPSFVIFASFTFVTTKYNEIDKKIFRSNKNILKYKKRFESTLRHYLHVSKNKIRTD